MTDAKLLSPPTNFAVIQLPGRQYPGVVVQGDTLHNFVSQLAEMRKLLAKRDLGELRDEIDLLFEDLSAVQRTFERVCSEQDVELPYSR